MYIFVLTALREKERDIYILKEFQFFWSSKISIFWLLTLLVDSKVKRDSNTFDKFFITSHVSAYLLGIHQRMFFFSIASPLLNSLVSNLIKTSEILREI